MKRCFTFNNYPDCKMVAKYLRTIISSTIHIQLGNSIAVAEDVYETAILEGKEFVEENGLSCNWADISGQEIPMNLVPIAIITLNENYTFSPHCLSASALDSLKFFTDFCESFLKRKLFTQIRFDGTIAFLIEDPHSTIEQLVIVQSLQEHRSYLRDNIYSNMLFTDYFGNILPND